MNKAEALQRLTLLFDVWAARVKADPDGHPINETNYGEACAAYLSELDEETDGQKLFPKTGGSV